MDSSHILLNLGSFRFGSSSIFCFHLSSAIPSNKQRCFEAKDALHIVEGGNVKHPHANDAANRYQHEWQNPFHLKQRQVLSASPQAAGTNPLDVVEKVQKATQKNETAHMDQTRECW